MHKYNFLARQLVQIYLEVPITVEAEDRDTAKKKLIQNSGLTDQLDLLPSLDEHIDVEWEGSSFVYESMQEIQPKDNDGFETLIFFEYDDHGRMDYDSFYSNSTKESES